MMDFFRAVPKKRKVKINGKSGIIFANLSKKNKIVFYFGNLLFIFAIISLIYLYYPLTKTLITYNLFKNTKSATNTLNSDIVQIDSNDLWIEIPKIGASSKIVTNISPFVKSEYKKVIDDNLVAHALNTSLPGSGAGTMSYLFAHSTQQGIGLVRKNSIFYLLGELQLEDKIFIRSKDKNIEYSVYKQIVVSPKEIEYLNYKEIDKEILLLQTCWPIGTDWKRLIIFASKIN